MKKVLDSFKSAINGTTDLIGEGYDHAAGLLKETLQNFYDVKDLTKETLASMANDLIALSPLIEKTGYRTKEINIGLSLPPRITFHFEKCSDVDKETIEAVLAENADKKLLKVIVATLVSADDFQKKLATGSFTLAEIDIEAGIPPQVNIKLANTIQRVE